MDYKETKCSTTHDRGNNTKKIQCIMFEGGKNWDLVEESVLQITVCMVTLSVMLLSVSYRTIVILRKLGMVPDPIWVGKLYDRVNNVEPGVGSCTVHCLLYKTLLLEIA